MLHAAAVFPFVLGRRPPVCSYLMDTILRLRGTVENHIRDVCELKASVYLQQFIAWKGELLFDLVTTSVDVILDVFGNLCACGIY